MLQKEDKVLFFSGGFAGVVGNLEGRNPPNARAPVESARSGWPLKSSSFASPAFPKRLIFVEVGLMGFKR